LIFKSLNQIKGTYKSVYRKALHFNSAALVDAAKDMKSSLQMELK
jgi:hypothetical protein